MSGLSKLFDIECNSVAVVRLTCSMVGGCLAVEIGMLLAGGVLLPIGTVVVDESVLVTTVVVRSLVVLLLPYTNFAACLDGSTMLTRNREDELVVFGKNVGEQLADDGGVIGDSTTRETENRLRDGLGAGDETGDGMGLGKGDLKRPVLPDLRFGSNR